MASSRSTRPPRRSVAVLCGGDTRWRSAQSAPPRSAVRHSCSRAKRWPTRNAPATPLPSFVTRVRAVVVRSVRCRCDRAFPADCACTASCCPPPRTKLAEPFQLKFAISARPTSVTRAATAARDTAVVAAAAAAAGAGAAAGCCCALTRSEPGRNRAHRTHEAPAACVECVACERARWRGVARRAAAAAAAVRLARLI